MKKDKNRLIDLNSEVTKRFLEIGERFAKLNYDSLIPKIDYESLFPKLDYESLLPKFNFSDSNASEMWETVNKTKKYGWTMTTCMTEKEFLVANTLDDNVEEFDKYFFNLYKEDDFKRYEIEKISILNNISEKNKKTIKQCFFNYERGNHHVIIPCLLSILEGEIAQFLSTDEAGNPLFRDWHNRVMRKQYDQMTLMEYTLVEFLREYLFIRNDFAKKKRNVIINRNWVLHGRDDPRLWRKSDALKIINNISMVLTIKTQEESLSLK